MKRKVMVTIPPFITEVEDAPTGAMRIGPNFHESYAVNVGLERAVDKLREGDFWFDLAKLQASVEPIREEIGENLDD